MHSGLRVHEKYLELLLRRMLKGLLFSTLTLLGVFSDGHIGRWVLMNGCLPRRVVVCKITWRRTLVFLLNVNSLHPFLAKLVDVNKAFSRVWVLINCHSLVCFLKLINPCQLYPPVSILLLSWSFSLLLQFLVSFLVLVPQARKNCRYLWLCLRFIHGSFLIFEVSPFLRGTSWA